MPHEPGAEGGVFQESLETSVIEGRSSVGSSVSMSMMGPCLLRSVNLFESMAEGDEGWMGRPWAGALDHLFGVKKRWRMDSGPRGPFQ